MVEHADKGLYTLRGVVEYADEGATMLRRVPEQGVVRAMMWQWCREKLEKGAINAEKSARLEDGVP